MTATPPISPAAVAPSALVAAHDRVQQRKALERELAASQARVAELERAAASPSPSRSVAAEVLPTPAAPSIPAEALWDRYDQAETPLAKYDAALAITAQAAGMPPPESIATEAGRAARIAELAAAVEKESDIRLRSRAVVQYAALSRGESPDRPDFAISEAACIARRDVLKAKLDQSKCPKERYRLASRMPR